MLISLSRNFIFLKPPRTAGSSTEYTLCKLAGRDSLLITKSGTLRYFYKRLRHYVFGEPKILRNIQYPVRRSEHFTLENLDTGHISYSLIRASTDRRLRHVNFDGLRKVINVRNPYLHEFSKFHLFSRGKGLFSPEDLLEPDEKAIGVISQAFKGFVRKRCENFVRFRDGLADGSIAPDTQMSGNIDFDRFWYFDRGREIDFEHVIRYEHFAEDLERVSRDLGLDFQTVVHRNPGYGAAKKVPCLPEYFDDEVVADIATYRDYCFRKFDYPRELVL